MADDTNSPVPARPLGLYPTAGESVDAPCADTNLERAVDSIGVGRLLICIADALAKDMQNPAVAARAYRIVLARMEDQTFDQIAEREGVTRERIRQILARARGIVIARPELFDGFGGLEQAARHHMAGSVERFRSWQWRRGIPV